MGLAAAHVHSLYVSRPRLDEARVRTGIIRLLDMIPDCCKAGTAARYAGTRPADKCVGPTDPGAARDPLIRPAAPGVALVEGDPGAIWGSHGVPDHLRPW